MPHLWWTCKNFVIAAAVVSMVCAAAFVAMGLPPEPDAGAALGPDWQCSRLALVLTTCSRVKHGEAGSFQLVKVPVCARLRA
jgi:hypothetical protein